ncbi:hypothetical protein HNV11_18485 [Spirosoma taeanense]|uniref:Uncharacterized protein n=1 Tax=Spirosoma taeanense TaxID=2735870 RepID=A0A6M5YD79_9BACT|nr:hypothetical protein [Spirosoma taeanense]QJW91221.1 hypothetical protein HNV11_18485 [Spirosoma taeanense]
MRLKIFFADFMSRELVFGFLPKFMAIGRVASSVADEAPFRSVEMKKGRHQATVSVSEEPAGRMNSEQPVRP